MTDTGQGLALKGADEIGGAQEDNTTNANLKGFIGGFTDGAYAYFVPWSTSEWPGTVHGNVVRIAVKSHTPGTGWSSGG